MLWLALSFVACEPEDELGEPACDALPDWEASAIGPFAVEAHADGRTLTASLRNVSSLVRRALHHPLAQPSAVVLVSADEAVIDPVDERTVEDTALLFVPKSAWTSLDTCEALPLGEATFTREGAGWALSWGPFTWSGLEPGRYTAIVTLPMRLAHYNDPLGTRRGIDHAWTGDVQSEPIDLVLP